MTFLINGEAADVTFTEEKNAKDLMDSFMQQLDQDLIISSVLINEKYYSSDSEDLEQITLDQIQTINIEVATQEEVSVSLLQESKQMLHNISLDLKENGYSHAREFGEIFSWLTETITTINRISVFPLAEAKLVISTIKQVWEYLNSPEREETKLESLASIISNLIMYLDSIQAKISSHFEIGKKDLQEAVDSGLALLPQIAESFQLGKDQEALGMVHTIINVLESATLYIKRILADFSDDKKEEIQELYNDINNLLAEIVEAFENGDFVLIGDLMEYELPEKLQSYKEQILS